MLTRDTARFLTLLAGLSFVAMLFVQQGSTFCALIARSARAIDAVDVPIWVADPHVRTIEDVKPLLDTDLQRVRSVPGVLWAEPIFVRMVEARLPNGSFQEVRLLGIDATTLTGRPGRMLLGDPLLLRQSNAVIVNKSGARLLGDPKIGDVFEMNDHEARVVGISDALPDLEDAPFVYTTYERSLDYIPFERKELSYIVAGPIQGMDAGRVAPLIHRETGLSAYTAQDFRKLTMNYIIHNTGIPIGFGVSLVLAFVVGMAIAGQTFLQFALQNEQYLAAFKAMGIATSVLIRMLLVQSLFVAIVSFGIGAGSAALVGLIVGPAGTLPYYMPWQLVAISFAAVLVLCVASTTLSVFRVRQLDAVTVFRT